MTTASVIERVCEDCGRRIYALAGDNRWRCAACRSALRVCRDCREAYEPRAGGDEFACSTCAAKWSEGVR